MTRRDTSASSASDSVPSAYDTRHPSLSDLGELYWTLPTHGTPEDITRIVLNHCVAWFDAPLGALWLQTSHTPRLLASSGISEKRAKQLHTRLELAQRPRRALVLHGTEVLADCIFAKRRLGALLALPTGENPEASGWLFLARFAHQPFSSFEVQLLQLLADRLLGVITPALRLQRLDAQARNLALLTEVYRSLDACSSLEELQHHITKSLAECFDLKAVALELHDHQGEAASSATIYVRPHTRAGHTVPATSSRVPTSVDELKSNLGPGLMVNVALKVRGHDLGTLTLARTDVPSSAVDGWQGLIDLLALPIALAVENCLMRGDPGISTQGP
jgi:hypothetical protein